MFFAVFLFFNISQSEQKPFTGANLIKIQANLNTEELFTKWKDYLAQNGFSIAKINNDFLSIETTNKTNPNVSFEYKLFSQIDETGVIEIFIEYRMKPNQESKTPYSEFKICKYSKENDNINKIIFDEVYKIISSFGEYEIYFEDNSAPSPPIDS